MRPASLALLLLAQSAAAQVRPSIQGTLVDGSGAPVQGAQLFLATAQSVIAEAISGEDGMFIFSSPPRGIVALRIIASGFEPMVLAVAAGDNRKVTLEVSGIRTAVNVTAARGAVGEGSRSPQLVSVRDLDGMDYPPLATLGHALADAPGVLLQQSATGQVSPFLRGLTGYHVLNLVDGVRFNNSTFRSGPNQYLAFIEPSQAQRVETVLGPAGVQYGSDALGGAIHVISPQARFSERRGELRAFGASADLSSGASGSISLGGPRVWWLGGATLRHYNDLRAGGGFDSRNAFRRFFGLNADQLQNLTGSRQRDTAYSQFGGHTKLALRLPGQNSVTLWYQRSEQNGVRGYKDLLGGLGRLRSDFTPQSLDFAYARWEKVGAGFLDTLSATLSWNSQADGSVRQGLRPVDPVIADDGRVTSSGYSVQASTHLSRRNALVFGGDIYRESVDSTRLDGGRQTRALYPDGSRYATYALFAEDSAQFFAGRLRATGGARLTGVTFDTDAEPRFGVIAASQSFRDLTWHANLSWRATSWLGFHALAGRGFRAPNLNDLGALGLNDLGFEIPSSDAIPAGALLATSAGENAVSSGRSLRSLGAERLFNYEAGVRVETRRLRARAQFFDAELHDPIVRRTLLFPLASLPTSLGGIPVAPIIPTADQRAQGVGAVATAIDPRAVKAFVNDGRSRYYGVESLVEYAFSPHWRLRSGYSFILGRDLHPNRNIRRLPPQQGHAALHYAGRRAWFTVTASAAGAQTHLSGGDIDDERIGASRRRSDVAAFFGGGRVQPFVTSTGVFTPIGETLRQIQDRVLPIGQTIHGVRIVDDNSRAPMFLSTAGWVSVDVITGMPLTESLDLSVGVSNLLDRNHRFHGSGIDAPGANAFLSFRWRF